ncbi:MAG: hypothetical protein FJY83_10900, partial [Candidatus Aminicenantes bacterium]|nr:hypothetical protein [Candidatus Aminicenantes bacterium]
MAVPYSAGTVRELARLYAGHEVLRPFRIRCHEPGAVLEVGLRGVFPGGRADVRLEVERFVGGGYAGQVYKVRLTDVVRREGEVEGL